MKKGSKILCGFLLCSSLILPSFNSLVVYASETTTIEQKEQGEKEDSQEKIINSQDINKLETTEENNREINSKPSADNQKEKRKQIETERDYMKTELTSIIKEKADNEVDNENISSDNEENASLKGTNDELIKKEEDSDHSTKTKFKPTKSFSDSLEINNENNKEKDNKEIEDENSFQGSEEMLIDLSSISVSKKNVKLGDKIKITFKTNPKVKTDHISVDYRLPNSSFRTKYIDFKFNKEKNLYEADLTIDDSFKSGLWKIDQIVLFNEVGNIPILYNKELHEAPPSHIVSNGLFLDFSNGDFYIEEYNSDNEPPIIDINSIIVSKKEVYFNELFKLGVKIKDKSDIQKVTVEYVNWKEDRNISDELKYNPNSGLYEGDFTLYGSSNDTGRWKISRIEAMDNANNAISIGNININENQTSLDDCLDLSRGDIILTDGFKDYASPELNYNSLHISKKSMERTGTNLVSLSVYDNDKKEDIEVYIKYYNETFWSKTAEFKLIYNAKKDLFEKEIDFDDLNMLGKWKIYSITLKDKTGNKKTIVNSQRYITEGDLKKDLSKGDFEAISSLKEIKLKLNGESSILSVGEKKECYVTYEPEDATNKENVSWSSSNENVATIENGYLIAKKPGKTIIKATVGDLSDSLEITVGIPLKSIQFDNHSLTFEKGEKGKLNILYEPSNTTDNQKVKFESTNSEIVSVDRNGSIKAVSPGVAFIRVSTQNLYGDYISSECRITVTSSLKGISINNSDIKLLKKQTNRLNVNFSPSDTTNDKAATWISSDDSIVKVDNDGNVSALKKGTAIITASINDYKAEAKVTVIDVDDYSQNDPNIKNVNYDAKIIENRAPLYKKYFAEGDYQFNFTPSNYYLKQIKVTKEVTTDRTWALAKIGRKEIGWIDKAALDIEKVTATKNVKYEAKINRKSDSINTKPYGTEGYALVAKSSDYFGKDVMVTKEATTQRATWALISVNGKELGWIDKAGLKAYEMISSEKNIKYTAKIARKTDTINTAPYGTKGAELVAKSSKYLGKQVQVTKEAVTKRTTWAYIYIDGKKVGWIDKNGLDIEKVTSSKNTSYTAWISRKTDGINTKPWGTEGYEPLGKSSDFYGEKVKVTKEAKTRRATWAYISINGKNIGWIDKSGLSRNEIVISEKGIQYNAKINRGTDNITTEPYGTKGYKTITKSSKYLNQQVKITKEAVTDRATWALISIGNKQIGWIDKRALDIEKVMDEKDIHYEATITRSKDTISTKPWGTEGYQVKASASDYLGKTISVSKEAKTRRATWALISINGKELGWIDKTALAQYETITSTKDVDYNAVVVRGTDSVTSKPYGTKGYKSITKSSTYLNKEVKVTKEAVTDRATWALISIGDKQIGWIDKAGLKQYEAIHSKKDINYFAIIRRGTDSITTDPYGTKGYKTIAKSSKYLNQQVKITKEAVTDRATWAYISIGNKKIGWIDKDALDIEKTTSIEEKEYVAVISRGTDTITTKPYGTEGFEIIAKSSSYLNKKVTVTKEAVTRRATWVLISVDGKELGWIDKAALTE